MHASLRALREDDLPAVFALQTESYTPALRDSLPAFASRLRIAAGCCHLAEADQLAMGYILAHPWLSRRPPAVDTVLSPPPSDGPRLLYVHDLSVSARAKGTGLGGRLVDAALEAGRRGGLLSAELVAVPGAAGFWQRMGFRSLDVAPDLARKVRQYGDGALYMARAL
ncbi:GNAT family N-acetyltransferase [Lysobacter sp. H21R4]|uniref:GNAT family N-acetyltransferase n=1 Tax=Lysobacter sp. H21R4 TaxID=2781021 RepID=UPI001888DE88|nr:GNAT family N-acetyltransferase [Lysobacter sp. H21R4]QOY62194.1 GNAT family N-acetyltransferase [Lysobacter sp. H21R4]